MNTHDAWEEIHRTKNWGVYPSEHIIRFVARNYYKLPRDQVKILDFGSGTGAHTWYLSREEFDTYAFDISETAIKKLNDMLDHEGLSAHADVCDGLNLAYENDFFDAVIDNVSIQSNPIADIICMYKTVFRILKPGGKLISVVFGKETTGYGTGIEIEPGTYEGLTEGLLQGLGCRHFFDEEELKNVLTQSGFKNISTDYLKYTDSRNTAHQWICIAEKI